ncbi:MAG: hypothetical protein LBC68_12915 [Prevotellaceae bacterium]|jgi:hypothetical protein|nr:hypothetical protein [Prevotellaceae bacterium]
MKKTANKILQELLEYCNTNYNQLAQDLKLKRTQNLYDIRNGKIKTISSELAIKIVELHPEINLSYLLTGEGEMLKETEVTEQRTRNKNLIPLYDAVAVGGTSEVAYMDAQKEPVTTIDAGDWFRDGTAAMRVHGESMMPVYMPGNIVVFKEIIDRELIVYGQDYVIETSEYRLLKRVQRSKLKNSILACSINDAIYESGQMKGKLIHEPFDISLNKIIHIFHVLGCVKRNTSSRIVYNESMQHVNI